MSTSLSDREPQAPCRPCPQPLSESSFSLLSAELCKSASSTVQTQLDEAASPQFPEEKGLHAKSVEQDPGTAAVQRSHSELIHSTQNRQHSGVWKASLSCSILAGLPFHRTPQPQTALCSTGMVGACGCRHTLWTTEILAFPKLVASVSESGLQAQPACLEQSHCKQSRALLRVHSPCCAHPGPSGSATGPRAGTKDVCTMTSASDLAPGLVSAAQDGIVQAMPLAACKAVVTPPEATVALHMVPEVTLGPSPQKAVFVQAVQWDTDGMTEVHGAMVASEVLGMAIQSTWMCSPSRCIGSKHSLSEESCRGPLRAIMQ
ncbi:LOW QUALITY PROTEIN: G protein-regulated inducer of neurite outgrowth 2 [Rhynchocyon petersi]